MHCKKNAFNALYSQELRASLWRSLYVAVATLTLGYYNASLSWSFYKQRGDFLNDYYFPLWTTQAPLYLFLSCAILPAYAFAAERKRGGFDVLSRFPTSTQTVILAKISAVLTLSVAACALLLAACFAFDFYRAAPLSTTLLEQVVDAEGALNVDALWRFSVCLFASLELLCWSAFWGTRIRRGSLAATAAVAAPCCVWAVLGVLFDPQTLQQATEVPPILAPLVCLVAGLSNFFQYDFYIELRALVCLVPLYGIYRLCRRDGATTAFNLPI